MKATESGWSALRDVLCAGNMIRKMSHSISCGDRPAQYRLPSTVGEHVLADGLRRLPFCELQPAVLEAFSIEHFAHKPEVVIERRIRKRKDNNNDDNDHDNSNDN